MAEEPKKQEPTNDLDKQIETICKTYEDKINELLSNHKKEMEELKKQVEEQKQQSQKIVQSVISGHFDNKPKEDKDNPEDDDDPEDMSPEKVEKRTLNELLKKFKITK